MNAKERSAYNRIYHRRNRKKHAVKMRQWLIKKLAENPNYYKEMYAKRVARKLANVGCIHWREYDDDGGTFEYCRKRECRVTCGSAWECAEKTSTAL